MKTNWRGEPAKKCWLCGSRRTRPIDHTTRECKDCGNHYAVWEMPDDHQVQEVPAAHP